MSDSNPELDPSKIIYCMEEAQKLTLEKDINLSLQELEKLFQKDEILKFLYKYVYEGKIDFSEEIKSEGNEVTEEEISKKQDQYCRELKKVFDLIDPGIFDKYSRRIANATIKILRAIYKRKKTISNKIRAVKVKVINDDCEEYKKKYEKLDVFKNIIHETIYLSNFYISELNNADSFVSKNLEDYYNEKNKIEFVNLINGEEKRATEDDLIQKVVGLKEENGKKFILETKQFIGEQIEIQNKLNKKIDNMINEMENLNQQKIDFEKYCNEDSVFTDINDVDFYG